MKKTPFLTLEKAKEIAAKLTGCMVKIQRSGAEDKMYGSVTSKEIAEALTEQFGIEIDKRKMQMDQIKTYGTYEIPVKLYAEISGKINVVVTK